MKLLATNINLISNELNYDVYDDDGSTVIVSGRSLDYTTAIAANPGDTTLSDLFTLMAQDAVAAKGTIKTKILAAKAAANAKAVVATNDAAEADSKLASMDTAAALITA